jgi:hypothetical protein
MTRNEKSPARTLLSRTAALGLLVAVCSAASALEWEELGPAPILTGRYTGRVSAIVCSKTNPDLYYVAGADGGVWRTYDGGATWTPLTDFMPTTAIGALALDPVDEQIIYAGTGEANYAHHSRFGLGLYKSTDGGDTGNACGRGLLWSLLFAPSDRPRQPAATLCRDYSGRRLSGAVRR